MMTALQVLISHLSPRLRRSILPLLFLMLVGAVAELATIGAIVPFLAAVTGQADSRVLEPVTAWLESVGVSGRLNVVYAVTALFAIAALLATITRLSLLWLVQKLVFGVSYELSVAVYSHALHQPYLYHTQRNSSEIIAAINKVQLVTNESLMPLMDAIVGSVMVAFIFSGLVAIDPVIAPAAAVGLAIAYIGVMLVTRRRLRRNSEIVARTQVRRVQAMQDGLGGIRDILLGRSQAVFVETFESEEARFRTARCRVGFMASAPRFLVEGAALIGIALIAAFAAERAGALANAIPVLGALALGAHRLLPRIQQLYIGWARTLGNRRNLIDLAQLLQEMPDSSGDDRDDSAPMSFEREITLVDVSHAYPGNRGQTLRNVNVTIRKGAKIGIAGETGSGKSTLIDIVLGLIEPTVGSVLIDDVRLTSANVRAWQKNVAHVPQFIFLADVSVAENIAFGVRKSEIDMARVRSAAAQAKLADVIAALPSGYETRVGERGVQFSGGQRQRIGIARAFYRRSKVMVFDEATSALDMDTEGAVMDAIAKLGSQVTVLVVAHRLSTLRGCDQIVWLGDGRIDAVTDGKAGVEGRRVGPIERQPSEPLAESARDACP